MLPYIAPGGSKVPSSPVVVVFVGVKTSEDGPNMLPYISLDRLSYRQVQSHFFSLAGGHIQGVWGGGAPPAWKGMKDHQDPNGA